MLDEKDRLILSELRKDSRRTTKEIAKKVRIPRTTVHERIKKMVRDNIIKSFTIIPNYSKTGLPVTAFILVSFLPNHDVSQQNLAKRISIIEGIYEVHIISGEWDLLIKVRGRSIEEIGKLVIDKLRQIKGVGKTVTCSCFSTIKEEL